jgi:SAM-dependent methyltransferase
MSQAISSFMRKHFRTIVIQRKSGSSSAAATNSARSWSGDGIQKIRNYGIDAQALDVRTLNPEQPFDVICCFQVLEHLDRLDELFTHLHHITTTRGRLFFSVPNPKRIEFNETHGALLDMPPNHIGRWNARAFEAMCSRHGWRLELFESEPQDAAAFSRQFAIYRLMRRQQIGGFVYSKLASSRSRLVRRVLQAPLMALEMSKVATMKAELNDPTLGDSLFVQMSKV